MKTFWDTTLVMKTVISILGNQIPKANFPLFCPVLRTLGVEPVARPASDLTLSPLLLSWKARGK
ncbi:hypothetical protein [Albibacterium profundi]|uniref:Uncharacterized protein n=1 Tax=Albibacterium profundi TaxID=3134906 RepID=A0ABV5C9S3_9SPHI